MYEERKANLKGIKVMSLPGAEKPCRGAVANAVTTFYKEAKMARQGAEETWLECWGNFLGTPDSYDWLRSRNTRHEAIEQDWRHKVHLGKAYELVETIHAYMMSAMFPNSQWCGLVPNTPGIRPLLGPLEVFFRHILEKAEVREAVDEWLRQLLVTGNSVMATPWDEGSDAPVFRPLDMFDFYLDPFSRDPNKANVTRVLQKTRIEIAELVKKGEYTGINTEELLQMKCSAEDVRLERRTVTEWQGITLPAAVSMFDTCDVLDYWGDLTLDDCVLKDVHAVVVSGILVKLERNPFHKTGKPFIFGTFKKIPMTAYGMGLLHPILGQLASLDIIHNQVLDNLELAINKIYTWVNDGVVNPEQIRNDPGAIIEVGDPTSVQPLQTGGLDTVGYIEIDKLESNADKACGAGPLISAGAGRSGERVTAEEVAATRDAGGNRLSAVHRHIEREFLLPLVRRAWNLIKHHRVKGGIARMPGGNGEEAFVEVEKSDFHLDVDFIVKGADHVVDREKAIEDITTFIGIVGSREELAQGLNWEPVLRKVVEVSGLFEDVNEVIAAPVEQGPSPEQMMMQQQALAAEQAQNAPMPISANGMPIPGLAEGLQENTPQVLPPSALNHALATEGVEGVAGAMTPPQGR